MSRRNTVNSGLPGWALADCINFAKATTTSRILWMGSTAGGDTDGNKANAIASGASQYWTVQGVEIANYADSTTGIELTIDVMDTNQTSVLETWKCVVFSKGQYNIVCGFGASASGKFLRFTLSNADGGNVFCRAFGVIQTP